MLISPTTRESPGGTPCGCSVRSPWVNCAVPSVLGVSRIAGSAGTARCGGQCRSPKGVVSASVREQRVSMSAEGLASEGDVLVGGVDVATSGEWCKSLTSRSECGSG